MNSHNPHDRLVEYFAVVGVPDDAIDFEELGDDSNHLISPSSESASLKPEQENDPRFASFKPHVIDRYPLTDHDNVKFLTGIHMFCFPTGLKLYDMMQMPLYYEFASSDGSGYYLYGFVLKIFEPLTEAQKKILHGHASKLKNFQADNLKQYIDNAFIPKCLCVLSHWPFSSCFRTFLTQLYRISLSPITIPLERIICNFVDEIPLPPPGRIKVQHVIGDETVVYVRPPLNNPITWIDLPFQVLFECLSLDNLLKAFSCLLCERQMVIVSSQYSLLLSFSKIMLTLMYPFEWTHVYIPLLPAKFEMVLIAPMPYLLGIHEDVLDSISTSIPEGVVKVYLDRNEIVDTPGDPILALPQHEGLKLLDRLNQVVPVYKNRQKDWTEHVLPLLDSAVHQSQRPFEVDDELIEKSKEYLRGKQGKWLPISLDKHSNNSTGPIEFDESSWLLCRTAFFRFFVSLLKDYKVFIVYDNSKESSTIKTGFDTSGFIGRRKRYNNSETDQRFLDKMTQTQYFQNFIDDHRELSNQKAETNTDVIFLEQSIDAKENRRLITKLIPTTKCQTPFLDDSSYAHSKTIVAFSADASNLEPFAKDIQSMYDRFPTLNPALFVPPRQVQKLHDMVIGKPKLRQKYQFTNLLQNAEAMNNPAEMIYASWFILFCASIRRNTPIALDFEDFYADEANKTITSFQNTSLFRKSRGSGEGSDIQSLPSISPSKNNNPSRYSFQSLAGDPHRKSIITNQQDKEHQELVEEKRLEKALTDLDLAINVLKKSQSCGSVVNEIVYRALIDACGHCGAIDYALKIIDHMYKSGIVPDSAVYSNLLQAFSMSSKETSGLDVLNYHNLQPAVKAANQRINSLSKKYSEETSDVNNTATPTPSTMRRMNTWGQGSGRSTREGSTLSTATVAKTTTPILNAAQTKTNASLNIFQKFLFGNEAKKKSQRRQSKHKERSNSRNDAPSEASKDESPIDKLRTNLFGSATRAADVNSPPSDPTKFIPHSFLIHIFPNLVIDLDRETCPDCKTRLSDHDIRQGWNKDPNDYTTHCPHCNKSFVAFFTVFSTSSEWIGSTGSASELYCEFLPPWVLIKEVQTMLTYHGIDFICCCNFRIQKPTLYWNLMVYFSDFNLPLEFLVGPCGLLPEPPRVSLSSSLLSAGQVLESSWLNPEDTDEESPDAEHVPQDKPTKRSKRVSLGVTTEIPDTQLFPSRQNHLRTDSTIVDSDEEGHDIEVQQELQHTRKKLWEFNKNFIHIRKRTRPKRPKSWSNNMSKSLHDIRGLLKSPKSDSLKNSESAAILSAQVPELGRTFSTPEPVSNMEYFSTKANLQAAVERRKSLPKDLVNKVVDKELRRASSDLQFSQRVPEEAMVDAIATPKAKSDTSQSEKVLSPLAEAFQQSHVS